MDIITKKSRSNIENNPSKVDSKFSNYKNQSTLNLKLELNQYHKPEPTIRSEKKVVSQQSNPEVEKNIKNINQVSQIQAPFLSITQWGLVGYNVVFIALIIGAVLFNWASIWQLPKSLISILWVTGFLFLTSTLWIFGQIRHRVTITLGDILFILAGLALVVITFINPNRIAFWGNTNRIFDAGIFIGFLVLLFILLKLFLENKALYILSLFISVLSILSAGVGVIVIYIPELLVNFSVLTQLRPSYTWLSESPKELALITLIAVNLIFLIVSKIKANNIIKFLIFSFYYFAFLVHILISIRLSGYSIYILTILTIIMHIIFYLKSISQDTKLKDKLKFIIIRASPVYGIVIIFLLYAMLVRPFKNNINFSEYSIIANPSLDISVDIARQSLQSDTWFGSSNIIYAWNRFAPADMNLDIPNFSFETLSNELINIGVKNGMVVLSLLALLAVWTLLSILRIVLIQKTFPIELYILCLAIIGSFLMPFTVVSKVLFILILILWNNIFTKYFKPILNFNLDINKISASISSLFTFVILFTIAVSVLASNKIYNIFKSQEYIVKASQVQNNLAEQVDLLAKAQSKSPYMIEYGNLYIQALIKQINEQAIELSNAANSEEANIDAEKQKNLQDNIAKAQDLIDDYKSTFAMDSRVIYWQLDLYSITHRYGEVDENLYLSNIARGKDLKPQSQDWNIYEAQYYARQSQKGKELNSEQLEQAKAILDDTIKKNQFSTEAYKNYYELLSLSEDYKGQIEILEKYVAIMLKKDSLVDSGLAYLLGVAYQNNKQYTEALAMYNKLLEIFPDYTNVYFKLGEIYEAQKKTDLAVQNYQKVLELDPNAKAARLKLEQIQ